MLKIFIGYALMHWFLNFHECLMVVCVVVLELSPCIDRIGSARGFGEYLMNFAIFSHLPKAGLYILSKMEFWRVYGGRCNCSRWA